MTHTKPSEQTRFYRSGREAFGSHFPLRRRVCAGDVFVAAVCVLGLIIWGITG